MPGERTFNLFLSNREVALLLWIGIGLVWRRFSNFKRYGRTYEPDDFFFLRKFNPVAIVWIILALHLAVTGVLANAGFWDIGALRISVVWFLITWRTTIPWLYTPRSEAIAAESCVIGYLMALAAYQVGVNFCPLPLWGEMIALPLLVVLAFFSTVSERGLIKWIWLLALLAIGLGRYHWHGNFGGVWAFRSWSEFMLAPVLAVTSIPVIYLLALWAMYRRVYDRMAYFVPLEADKKMHGRWLLANCHVNFSKLEAAFKVNAYALALTKSQAEMEELIQKELNPVAEAAPKAEAA